MKNNYKYIGLFVGLFAFIFVACDDNIDPIVEELKFGRAFTPLELTARIRNTTTLELSWKVSNDVDSYVIEISQDNLEFNSIIKTVSVAPDEVPYSVLLDGDTQYSARVKAVSNNAAESRWAVVAFQTDPENIFEPVLGEDITVSSVTLKWPAGSDVTHFIITPGDIERPITDEERGAGEATIEGLSDFTEYTVKLYNAVEVRGTVNFRTLVVGTEIHPEDDLNAAIAAAAEGDVLVLHPGDYLVYTGKITINKSISIRGLYPYDKPLVHVQFVLEDGVQNVEVGDLEMTGKHMNAGVAETLDHAFQYTTTGVDYGSLNISGCDIHDYSKSLFSGSSSVISKIASISMDACVVFNVLADGADFIDFRGGYVGNLSLTNSTFYNCAPDRDFIRLDNSSASFPGSVSNVLIDHCTLYKVSSGSSSRRILYVRFVDNALTVKNTIIGESAGIYTNQSLSAQPVCTNNNYFNAPGFYTAGYVSNIKIDNSGDHRTLDPGFADAAAGNFTVSNQTIIDNNIGDPRWLP